MNTLRRFITECIIAVRLLGARHGLFWIAAALAHPKRLLNSRSLGHADRALGATLTVRCPMGPLHLADTDFGICREIIGHDCYRVAAVASQIRTAIDLGCNTGVFSSYLAHMSPLCTITAVDANGEFIQAARRNAERNGLAGRITVLHGFIGKPSRLTAISPQPLDAALLIPGISVGNIVNTMGCCDFLKCDIEGAEADLFAGDLDWAKHVKFMAIEYHWTADDGRRIAAALETVGFRTELAPHRDLGYIYAINMRHQ